MTRIIGATLGSLALLGIIVGWLIGDLPDPVAVHFGVRGVADGFSPRSDVWPLALGIPASAAMLMTALTWSMRRPPIGMRWSLGLPAGIVWTVGGIIVAMLLPQRGLALASDAVVAPAGIAAALVVGVGVTFLASRLAGSVEPDATTAPAPAGHPRADLPAASTVLWTATTPTGSVPQVLAIVVVGMAVAVGIVVDWWIAAILLAAAFLVAASARFRVTIGPAEVRIAGLVAGWPRLVVPLETVTAATPATIRPFEYGGWGLRMQPGLDTTAVVTTAGPGLELARTDGSRVVVSMDDADEAAAVVTALLDRRGDITTSPGGG